jgi:hypothetical protein
MAAIHFGGEWGKTKAPKGGKKAMGVHPGGSSHMTKKGALQTTFAKPGMSKK